MKRIIALLFALIMMALAASCGKEDPPMEPQMSGSYYYNVAEFKRAENDIGEEEGIERLSDLEKAYLQNVYYEVIALDEENKFAALDVSLPDYAKVLPQIINNALDENKEASHEELLQIVQTDLERALTVGIDGITVAVNMAITEEAGAWKLIYNEQWDQAVFGGLESMHQEYRAMLEEFQGTEPSVPEKMEAANPEETESAGLEEMEGSDPETINNGGEGVKYADAYLYWLLADDGFELIYQPQGGEREVLYTDTSSRNLNVPYGAVSFELRTRNLYLSNGCVFFEQRTEDDTEWCIYRIDLKDRSLQTMGNAQIQGINDAEDILIVKNGEDKLFYAYDTRGETAAKQLSIPSDAEFAGMGSECAYFSQETDDYRGIKLYGLMLSNLEAEVISEVYVDEDWLNESGLQPGNGDSPYTLEHLQETDSSVYYSCGFRAGTGRYFMGGFLMRYDKESKNSVVIDSIGDPDYIAGEEFYAFIEDGVESVVYWSRTAGEVQIYNAQTGEITETDMVPARLNEPFHLWRYEHDTWDVTPYWIYAKPDGEMLEIIPKLTFDLDEETPYYIRRICYMGDITLFDIVYHKDNPNTNEYSWRDETMEYRREQYCYDMRNGTIELLADRILPD